MILEMFGIRLATYVDLGKELGVSTNQVYMWSMRRARNGFPEPVLHRRSGNGVNEAPWFDIDEVIDWSIRYKPSKGRPPHSSKENA